jgi:hypothetical protein
MSWLLSSAWAYPALEVLHLVGVALLLGNLVLFELRVFGRGAALPVEALARLALPLALLGFALCALSGLLMFATNPAELLANRVFVLKMSLLMLAGCNAAMFHARGSVQKLDRTARVQAAASAMMWLTVLALGRWIAYV